MRTGLFVVGLSVCLFCGQALAGHLEVLTLDQRHHLEPVDLVELRASSSRLVQSPITRSSLDQLTMERGRVVIDGARPLVLDLSLAQTAVTFELDDARDQAVLVLRVFHGDQEIGRQVFAHEMPPGSRVGLIQSGQIGAISERPFDRLMLQRVDSSAGDYPITLEALGVSSALRHSQAHLRGNTGALACIIPLAAAYNLSFFASLVPLPGADIAAAAAYVANLALKSCKPSLNAPADVNRTVPAGQCEIAIEQEHMAYTYTDVLGIPIDTQSDWGELGTPRMLHHNTDVDVVLLAGSPRNPRPPIAQFTDLDFLLSSASFDASDKIYEACREDGSVRFSQFDGEGPLYECPYNEDRTLSFPVGRNTVTWIANTRISPVDLVPPIPGLPPGAKFQPFSGLLYNIWLEFWQGVLDEEVSGWRVFNFQTEFQDVIVYDQIPPTITPLLGTEGNAIAELVDGELQVTIEADEVGGVSRRRYQAILRSFLNVTDACDRDTTLSLSFPKAELRNFWPVSTDTEDNAFVVTWTARDPGPNLAGLENETERTMRIEVLDRQPPTLVPPPDIVEIDAAEVSDLGQPGLFDLVDLSPQVSNDANLPLGLGLHEVTWTAVDAAGNSSQAVQIVNVKASNFPPVALAQTGPNREAAVSFEPTPIRLRGNDADGDPLRFQIDDRPDNGFFVAPLYPYFIEDFRVEQSVSDGALLLTCNNGEGTDRRFNLEFPSEPSFLSVTDDGRTYVVDKGRINCNPGPPTEAERESRLAVFGNDGALLDSIGIDGVDLQDVVVDSNRDRLYLSSERTLRIYDLDLQLQVSYGIQNVKNRATGLACAPSGLPQQGGGCTLKEGRSALIDENELIYFMNDVGAIMVFDGTLPDDFDCSVTANCSHTPSYVGVLTDLNFNEQGNELALDPLGRLYAGRLSRLYRYLPSFIAGDGLAYPGGLEGWMGRCDIDLAPGDQAACDLTNRRSLGFSCTDAICDVDVALSPSEQEICGELGIGGQPRWGCRPGQFRGTPALDLAPDGTVYVADGGNARIQRFSTDGFFAGQAKSTGSGSGFVVGDFGNPRNVSVNSSRFYILDPQTNLLHISLLTPFIEIGDDYADLVYQSTNDFACVDSADCIDRFSFRVSDGVRDADTGQPEVSAPAEVEVEVSRNFRPPFANPGIAQVVLEDTLTAIPLDGSDPDPLDTLAYVVIDPPTQGELIINGQNVSYVPNQDAFGGDRFFFAVDDGTETSTAEAVEIEIIEINDAPIISVPDEAIEGGTGYRVDLELVVRDPDPDENLTVSVNWGDGTVEAEGDFDADGQPTGPIMSHGGEGSGRILADHVYLTAGNKTAEVCVTDRLQPGPGETEIPTPGLSLTQCEDIAINIADGIELELSATPSTDVALSGQFVTYQFQVENRMPDAGLGLTATGIELTFRLAPGFDPTSITVPAGCARDGFWLACVVNDLSPGQSSSFNVTAQVAAATQSGALLLSEVEVMLDQTTFNSRLDLVLTTAVSRPADFQVGAVGDALKDVGDANPGDGLCASDDGVCTLRAAVQEASASGLPKVVALGNGRYLLDEQLVLSGSLVLLGNGPGQTFIHGKRLVAPPGTDLRLEGMTISGGGLLAAPVDSLTIRRARFTNNRIESSFGGAIQALTSSLDIRDTTFDNNSSTVDGGTLMCFDCSGVLENVTVTGGSGGGLTFTGSGSMALNHVTITGTGGGSGWELPFGAALHVYDDMQVSISNSVVADNYSTGPSSDCAISVNAALISLGGNAFGQGNTCGSARESADIEIAGALLAPLSAGPDGLPIRLPLPGSPLIDALPPTGCLSTDTRGISRPQDGDEDGFALCDIGSVERRADGVFRDRFN